MSRRRNAYAAAADAQMNGLAEDRSESTARYLATLVYQRPAGRLIASLPPFHFVYPYPVNRPERALSLVEVSMAGISHHAYTAL